MKNQAHGQLSPDSTKVLGRQDHQNGRLQKSFQTPLEIQAFTFAFTFTLDLKR